VRAGRCSGRLAVWLGCSLAVVTACMPLATRRQWQPAQGYAALLAQARDEADQLTDLVAEIRVTADNGVQRQQASAVLQLKSPGMLRLEVRGPLYSHLLTVVQVDDTLYVEGPAVDGAWHGPVRGPLLARLTGLELGGYDLRDALLGVVQPAPVEAVEPLPDGDLAVVRLQSGAGGRHRVWIDSGRGLVRREELAVRTPGGC